MSAALVFDSGVKMEEDPLLEHSEVDGEWQPLLSGSKTSGGGHEYSDIVNFPSILTHS